MFEEILKQLEELRKEVDDLKRQLGETDSISVYSSLEQANSSDLYDGKVFVIPNAGLFVYSRGELKKI